MTIIYEQGHTIDKIDNTMGIVVEKVSRGVEELNQAEKQQKKCVIM
jgi:hypothetical protein